MQVIHQHTSAIAFRKLISIWLTLRMDWRRIL
jgi:hypothetical protein